MDMSFSCDEIEERDIEVAAQPGHDDISVHTCTGFCLREAGRNAHPYRSVQQFCTSSCHLSGLVNWTFSNQTQSNYNPLIDFAWVRESNLIKLARKFCQSNTSEHNRTLGNWTLQQLNLKPASSGFKQALHSNELYIAWLQFQIRVRKMSQRVENVKLTILER